MVSDPFGQLEVYGLFTDPLHVKLRFKPFRTLIYGSSLGAYAPLAANYGVSPRNETRRIPNDLQEHGSCEEGTLLSANSVATTVVAVRDISMTAAGSTCRGAALLRAQATLDYILVTSPPALQLYHRQDLGPSCPSGASPKIHPRLAEYRRISIAWVVRESRQVRKPAIVYTESFNRSARKTDFRARDLVSASVLDRFLFLF